jgi:uncharacterized membrane protein
MTRAELIASIRAAAAGYDRGHGYVSAIDAVDSVILLLAEVDRLTAERDALQRHADYAALLASHSDHTDQERGR